MTSCGYDTLHDSINTNSKASKILLVHGSSPENAGLRWSATVVSLIVAQEMPLFSIMWPHQSFMLRTIIDILFSLY